MASKTKNYREQLAERLPFKTYRENWQRRIKAAQGSLRSVSRRLPWSRALTRKGVLYLSALLMAVVAAAGVIYLAYGPGAGDEIGKGEEVSGLETLAGEAPFQFEHGSGDLPLPDKREIGGSAAGGAVVGNGVGPAPDSEPTAEEMVVPVLAEELPPLPGRLINPVVAPVSAAFGWRKHPVLGDWRYHPGVDLAASPGTPVQAVLDGSVADIYQDPVLGQVLVLAHGPNWETRYGHCQDVSVEIGGYLAQGEVMAVVGETGLCDEHHLHFEIRCNGQALDPQEYLPAPNSPAEGE